MSSGEAFQQAPVPPKAQGAQDSGGSVHMTPFSPTTLLCSSSEGHKAYRVGDQPLPVPTAPWILYPTCLYTDCAHLDLLDKTAAQALTGWLCLGQGTAPGNCISLVILPMPTAAQQDRIWLQQELLASALRTSLKRARGKQ